MNEFKYFDHLMENKFDDRFFLDIIKFELDKRLYHYGSNFVQNHEHITNFNKLLFPLWYFKKYFSHLKITNDSAKKKILSTSYFNLYQKLEQIGYSVYSPPFMINTNKVLRSWQLNMKSFELLKLIKFSNFNDLLNQSSFIQISEYINLFKATSVEKRIDALIVSNDETAINKIAIETFRKINKPSFIFLHGLPGVYNNLDNNRADYLIVWGAKIKEHFVKAGIDSKKIFVAGHPLFDIKNTIENLRFSLDNILVTSKVLGGSQHSDGVHLTDRGNLIYYLNSIQSTLMRLGVKYVRLRPHPMQNVLWYQHFIDTKFFHLDSRSLNQSLDQSSLVIGPTSSLLVESYFHKVNYLVYEPLNNGLCLEGRQPAPPFDGSDSRIPVAISTDELFYLLKNKITIDGSFVYDYIQYPFDMSFLKKLI